MLGYLLKRSININKEITAHGVGLLINGCLGGFCSQAGMSMTTLHKSAGGNTWISSLTVALILLCIFIIIY